MTNEITKNKILSFEELGDKWFCYVEKAITKETIDESLKLLDELENLGFKNTDAFPGFGGEIAINIYDINGNNDNLQKGIECIIEGNGTWTYSLELWERNNDNETWKYIDDIKYADNLNLENVINNIKETL